MGTITPEMARVVEEQRLGFVATIGRDGAPNLSPKGTVAVLDEDRLMFADLASPNTVANLMANPATEVDVVDPFRRKGSGSRRPRSSVPNMRGSRSSSNASAPGPEPSAIPSDGSVTSS